MRIPVRIPTHNKLLVKEGQRADFGMPFLLAAHPKMTTLPLAQLMGCEPAKIFHIVKKSIGDTIVPGDVLAEHKSFMATKKYLSQISGILKSIDHEHGNLLIELAGSEPSQIMCHFSGEITGIYDGYLEIQTKHAKKGTVREALHVLGAMIFYAESPNHPFSEEEIKDKIICARDIDRIHHTKLEALGAKGLILSEPVASHSSIPQIILEDAALFDELLTKKYPFILTSPEDRVVYFYEV